MLTAEVKNPDGLRLTRSDKDGIWLHFEIEGGGTGGGIRLDDLVCMPSRIKWAEDQFEKAEAKKSTDNLKGKKMKAEQLAEMFHESYEELAPQFGYETREESRKPWEDVPEQNQKLMTAVAAKILTALASPGRPQISDDDIGFVFAELHRKVRDRLEEKGRGILISRHEVLGVIEEERHELVRAIESGSEPEVIDELLDITVAGIVGLASAKTGQLEW